MIKNFLQDKRAVLAASLLALIALIGLASILSHVNLRPAQPLFRAGNDSRTAPTTIEEITASLGDIPVWKQFAFFGGIFLLVVLFSLLLSPETRKRLLIMLFRLAASVAAILYLFKHNPELFRGLLPAPEDLSSAENLNNALENSAPPSFEAPQISNAFSFFVTILLTAVLFFTLWKLYQWWMNQPSAGNSSALSEIARIAQSSLRELSAQRIPSQDIIIQCYESMSDAVDQKRGLYRSEAMTAAEFAQKLEQAGLPREPVMRLTRLFESARYGSKASTQSDAEEAAACLTSILQSCGAGQ